MAVEPQINGIVSETFEIARSDAAGLLSGAFAGVPSFIKDLIDWKGSPTLAGSRGLAGHMATKDNPFASKWRGAGIVSLGKSATPEAGLISSTEPLANGPTRNPWDLSRTPGGSSGGSGAAVAAGQVPLTLGSDTNGSIRVPASLCGVWGLKPTFGRLSRRGSYPFVHSLDHLGPFADDLPGLALAYDALQGADPLDPGCHATTVQPTVHSLGLGIQGLRIGVLGGYFAEHTTAPFWFQLYVMRDEDFVDAIIERARSSRATTCRSVRRDASASAHHSLARGSSASSGR